MSTSGSDTVYDLVGGMAFFVRLCRRFYEGIADDPVLRPMYPDDLSGSIDLLAGFLAQYWGGPPDYSAARGHPRLRMRHAPFVIDRGARDRWLAHMLAALDESDASDEVKLAMASYFDDAATHMINAPAE